MLIQYKFILLIWLIFVVIQMSKYLYAFTLSIYELSMISQVSTTVYLMMTIKFNLFKLIVRSCLLQYALIMQVTDIVYNFYYIVCKMYIVKDFSLIDIHYKE